MAGLVRLRRCSGESRCRKVMCRGGKGSVSVRYENRGEKYSPIIISAKQTLQTNQTIKQITPKTHFLVFAKTGLLQRSTSAAGLHGRNDAAVSDEPGVHAGSY